MDTEPVIYYSIAFSFLNKAENRAFSTLSQSRVSDEAETRALQR